MKSAKLLLGFVAVFVAGGAVADRVPPGTNEEIAARLAPFGNICRSGDPCASGSTATADAGSAMSGEQVYDQFCGTCHKTGVAQAPVLGDAGAWEPRVAKGMDTLWQHTLNGFNAMPPKDTCMNCSDEELRAAMDYLVEQAE